MTVLVTGGAGYVGFNVVEDLLANGREVVLETDQPTRVLHELTAEALDEGRELENLSVRRPTLEEVYLSLTGEEEAGK